MKYLAMLKSEKRPPALLQKLQKAPKPPETELQKLQKAPFYSYCTTEGRVFQKTQSSRSGPQWCQDHLDVLLAGGWTEKELFHPTLPRGLALLEQWSRPGLQVELAAGLVRFKWQRGDGSEVVQVARPDTMVTI